MTKTAFIFPGQGSQSVGMQSDLAKHLPIIKKTFAEASNVLGYDLWKLTSEGPEERLNQTEFTQPALLAAGVAVWRAWLELEGDLPAYLAGHSLGEYTALTCSGSLDFSDAISLVAERGKLMQEAVAEGEGAMAAIVGLTDEEVQKICQNAAEGQILAPANFNSIGQVVIAGETTAVQRAIELAKQANAKIAKLIPVSVPSHCLLMESAAQKLEVALNKIKIKKPRIPVIHNVDVCTHNDASDIRSALVRQLYSPVRWVETIQTFSKAHIHILIEFGPGKVLSGLNKRIDSHIKNLSINSCDDLEHALNSFCSCSV